MTTTERNKHLRELADLIAADVAQALGYADRPRCQLITRRRGHGYPGGNFSIPEWTAAAGVPDDFFAYYVAHEVCHCLLRTQGHGPDFRALEVRALAHLGLAPVYERNGAGPYVDGLRDARTGTLTTFFPFVPGVSGAKRTGFPRKATPDDEKIFLQA